MTREQATAVYAKHGIISDAEARELGLGSAGQRQRNDELRIYRVLGELMQRIPVDTRIGSWTIFHCDIDIRLGGYGVSDHEHRAHMMMLAEQFDLTYAEGDAGHGPVRNMIVATGEYEGVPIKFWRYVEPCHCENCEAGR